MRDGTTVYEDRRERHRPRPLSKSRFKSSGMIYSMPDRRWKYPQKKIPRFSTKNSHDFQFRTFQQSIYFEAKPAFRAINFVCTTFIASAPPAAFWSLIDKFDIFRLEKYPVSVLRIPMEIVGFQKVWIRILSMPPFHLDGIHGIQPLVPL